MVLVSHMIYKGHVTEGPSCFMLVLLKVSQPSQQVWWLQTLWYWRYNASLLRDLARLCAKGSCALYVGAHEIKSSCCYVQWSQALRQWRYDGFHLSRNLKRPCEQSVKWLFGQEPLRICHHPTKFDGHRHYSIEDMIVSLCHVMSQDHLIKK